MVADAHSVHEPLSREQSADSVSGWFVPLVILIAVVAFVIRRSVSGGPEAEDGAPV